MAKKKTEREMREMARVARRMALEAMVEAALVLTTRTLDELSEMDTEVLEGLLRRSKELATELKNANRAAEAELKHRAKGGK
jgi:hypothetical protein